MGFLMFAGMIGSMAYMTHFAKNETKAIISDSVLQPTYNEQKDKDNIKKNFKLICKRCNVKTDVNGNPLYKKHYNSCLAYLQYQGFTENTTNYFKTIYLDKYNKKYENKTKQIKFKHNDLLALHYENNTPNQRETKIFRYPHNGDTQEKCQKLMQNELWNKLVKHYNIVPNGGSNIEVWTITTKPSILKQIDTIYDEVCYLEGFYNN